MISAESQFDYSGTYDIFTKDNSANEACTNNGSGGFLVMSRTPDPLQFVLTYPGFSMDMSYQGNGILQGTVSGTYDEDDGTTTETWNISVDSKGNMTGSSTWQYSQSDPPFSCTGTTSLEGNIR